MNNPIFAHITVSYMKALCLTAVLLLSPLLAWGAASQDSLAMSSLLKKGLEELVELEVSLATGTSRPLKLAPSVATVITAQDIEDMGATTLDQILETVPGLHVQPSGTSIFSSIWSIRGIYTQMNPQVLLLIDGQPLKVNVNSMRPYRLRMPVSMISRIEIIRGPGSAVLGADAFAGTINIITKESSDIDGSNMGIRGGSFGSYDLWAQHGGTYKGWDIAFGAEYSKGDGDKNRIIEKDGLGTDPSSLAPGPLDTHYEELNADLSIRKGKFAVKLHNTWIMGSGIGAGISNTLNGGRSKTDGFFLIGSLNYNEKDFFKDFDLAATVSGAYSRIENTFYFVPSGYLRSLGLCSTTHSDCEMIGKPGGSELRGGVELAGIYRGFINHALRLALGMHNLDVNTFQHKNYGKGVPVQYGPMVDITNTTYVYMTDKSRRLYYIAIQDEWAFTKNWELTTGIRYDSYSDFGNAISPRFALVWSTSPELSAKLMYGRAFKAPSFGEMFTQNNPALSGNPSLKPETIDTYEMALDYRPNRSVRFGLNIFEYRIDGLIDYVSDPAPATTRTAQNARDQKGRGVEVEAEWQATDKLRLRSNFSFQRSVDTTASAVVPDVPAAKFYLNAHWKFLSEWSLDGQYFWISSRHRPVGDARPDLKEYDLVNMTLRKKNIVKDWDFSLAIRNLFDSDNREPAPASVPNDFPMEGRSFWAELRYHF